MPGTPCPCSVPTQGPHPKGFPYPIPRQPLFPGVLLTREDQETHGTCDHRAGDRNKHWEKHQKALRKDGKEENFLDSPGLPGWRDPCARNTLSLLCPLSRGCQDPPALPGQREEGTGGAGSRRGGGRGTQGPPEPMQREDIPSGKGEGTAGGVPATAPSACRGMGEPPGRGYPDGGGGSKSQIPIGPQIQPGQSSKGSD